MKSAQLSIAAYYCNNYEYYQAVVEGQEFIKDDKGNDIYVGEDGHTANAKAFGIITEADWLQLRDTQDGDLLHRLSLLRKSSKAMTFGTLFGCSGTKLANMANVSVKQGNVMKDRFLDSIGLTEVVNRLDRMTTKYKRANGGYIETALGYYVHSSSPHSRVNYLIQSTEAVLQKIAVNLFERKIAKEIKVGNMDAQKVLDYHDEVLIEAALGCEHEVGELMCQCYTEASNMCFEWHKTKSKFFTDLTFPFDLNGGYKVGMTYLETH